MAVSAGVNEANADAPKYARFSRRLRGIAIDFMLFTVAMVAALQVAIVLNSDDLARVIGFGFIAGFFLYEPLLVSFAGGTIGHYLSNLRVVDDRTNGNVSLPKAVARVIIKAALSWYSFITMAAARRHQAVHDLLTRSTVQIRDPAKALSGHYARERFELSSPGMPSRARRIVVTAIYLLLLILVLGAALNVLVSDACVDQGRHRCSAIELVWLYGLSLGGIVLFALCIGRGWRGRLWGARRHAEST